MVSLEYTHIKEAPITPSQNAQDQSPRLVGLVREYIERTTDNENGTLKK